jgi:type II secretory pathway component GspD/PulD (secretin)
MNSFFYLRASGIARYTAALTICTFSLTSLAQSAPSLAPASASDAGSHIETIHPTLSKHQAQAADNAYLVGARLLTKEDLPGAEIQFNKAVKLNPANRDYALALALTHQRHVTQLVQQAGKARLLGQPEKAEALLAEAALLDPNNSSVIQHLPQAASASLFHPEIEPWIHDAPRIAGPITLNPSTKKQDFHLHTDQQTVLRTVFTTYGIRTVFDDSVERKNMRFDLEDAAYQQAVPILLNMTNLFAVPLDANSVLVAKDTPENRERLERLLQETISIPGMTNQEMDELGNVVRNVFDVKQLTVEKSSGSLVLRAPADTLNYINLTLADLIDGGSEVTMELKLYMVDRTNQRNIGAQLPQQVGIYSVASEAQNLVSSNQSLVNQAIAQGLIPANASNITIALALIASGLVQSTLLSSTIGVFGGGITQTGVTTNQNPAFNLALTSSNTRALDDIQLRVSDRQAATFLVGERYPITTATYSNGLTGQQTAGLSNVSVNGVSASSLLNSASSSITIPQIQYEDLGLTLKATPFVQRSGAIKMHIELKIESLTGDSLDGIPVLNNQQFTSDITVDDGETAMMASSLNKSETNAINGLPGLGALPGFQSALSDTTGSTSSSSLILLVTPHVTRRRPNLSTGPRIAVNLREPAG